jgi:hypothetical protein
MTSLPLARTHAPPPRTLGACAVPFVRSCTAFACAARAGATVLSAVGCVCVCVCVWQPEMCSTNARRELSRRLRDRTGGLHLGAVSRQRAEMLGSRAQQAVRDGSHPPPAPRGCCCHALCLPSAPSRHAFWELANAPARGLCGVGQGGAAQWG